MLNVYIWGHVVKCSRDAFLLTRWWLLIYISHIKPSVPELGRCSSWEFGCRGWISHIQFSPLIRAEYVTLVLLNLALIAGLQKCIGAGTLDFHGFLDKNWGFLPCWTCFLCFHPSSSLLHHQIPLSQSEIPALLKSVEALTPAPARSGFLPGCLFSLITPSLLLCPTLPRAKFNTSLSTISVTPLWTPSKLKCWVPRTLSAVSGAV